MKVAGPTINEVLDAFLVEQKERLAAASSRRYENVIGLLRSSLDGYAYQSLSKQEREHWQERHDRDETSGSFCNTFGSDKIIENLSEFLGYFMVSKVIGGKDLLRAAGTVTKKLAAWLEERGYANAEEEADAREQAEDAARDLPRAEELATLLWRASETPSTGSVLEEWEGDFATISRAERGKIWFRDFGGSDDIGPVIVPPRASDLAQPGWSVSALLLGRTRRGWRILETGNVYPY